MFHKGGRCWGVGCWGMGPYPECFIEADDVGVLGCCVSGVGVCRPYLECFIEADDAGVLCVVCWGV